MPGRKAWMLHLPASFKNGQVPLALSMFKLGKIRPSTTDSITCTPIICASGIPSPLSNRHTSYGSNTTEFPIPLQQAEQPSHSLQPSFAISLLLYNFPSVKVDKSPSLFISCNCSLPAFHCIFCFSLCLRKNFCAMKKETFIDKLSSKCYRNTC